MKKKILIIGKKSFVGSNLFKFFKKKNIAVYITSYEKFITNTKKIDYDYIINCSSNKEFIKKKYQLRNDYDLLIAKKIINSNTKLVILSTRKVYKSKFNIKESDKVKPDCHYSRNKYLSETNVKKILVDKVLIFRISNIVGITKKRKRKLHKTFIDIFFENVTKGYVYRHKRTYKDFISIQKFCKITYELIQKNSIGLFNISIGKKVYLNNIIEWLNFYNPKNVIFIKSQIFFNKECFTLNNKKLMNEIKIKNDLKELKNDCLEISKKFFLNK